MDKRYSFFLLFSILIWTPVNSFQYNFFDTDQLTHFRFQRSGGTGDFDAADEDDFAMSHDISAANSSTDPGSFEHGEEATEPSSNLEGRIVGGHEAAEFYLPYQVYYRDAGTKKFICGGALTLVNQVQVVVTTASCIWTGVPLANSTIDLRNVEIFAGALNISVTHVTLHEQITHMKMATMHESYNHETYDNDIALFFLDPGFLETKAVRPIRLPGADYAVPNIVEVSGWGSVIPGGNLSETLKVITIHTVAGPRCATQYRVATTEHQFCGRGTQDKGSCYGDSGGPVVGTDNTTRTNVLAGIVSRAVGFQCGNRYKPSIFTKISTYVDWINAKTNAFKQAFPPEGDDDDENVPVPPEIGE